MNKKFGITGVGGYVAPKHLKAILETGNVLTTALDITDSVGLLDSYFPEVDFFNEPERFDRHLEKLYRKGEGIDYLSICSPNYLHDAHIRMGLRTGAHAICEKPLVLNPWNLDFLEELEQESGKRVYTILQLRVHPALIALKEKMEKTGTSDKKEINLTYITSRGPWYLRSWKGNLEKSGGLASNIGIHFFDMLIWMFGQAESIEVHINEEKVVSGFLNLERARVKWFLSIDKNMLPEDVKKAGQMTYRSITVDKEEIEFSGGFTNLHTLVYESILKGEGFGITEARDSIEIIQNIRTATVKPEKENMHEKLIELNR